MGMRTVYVCCMFFASLPVGGCKSAMGDPRNAPGDSTTGDAVQGGGDLASAGDPPLGGDVGQPGDSFDCNALATPVDITGAELSIQLTWPSECVCFLGYRKYPAKPCRGRGHNTGQKLRNLYLSCSQHHLWRRCRLLCLMYLVVVAVAACSCSTEPRNR